MNRRDVLRAALLGSAAFVMRPAWSLGAEKHDVSADLVALERRHGGRLGVAVLDTENGRCLVHRGNERFLMCSTFKLLLVATVLKQADIGKEQLDRRIVFDHGALLDWAPVTKLNLGPPGMSIAGLCEAAMIISDNTAANLLLDAVGGPPAVTAYVRSFGDTKTRLDHGEPLVNRKHGDEDTTTPWSMLGTMRKMLLGDALSEGSRKQLTRWFVCNQTGAQTLRAGLPSGWRSGDKTGSGRHANNDIAVVWPPRRKPLLLTAYYMTEEHDVTARKAVLADVGRIVAAL